MLLFKRGLPNLSLLALLTFLLENVESSYFGPANDPIVALKIPDLHHNTALDLCRKMNETRIPHAHRYIWAFIHPGKKSVNSLEKSDEFSTEKHLAVSPACTVYKWRFCDGKTRFPLVDKCGFFEIIPQSPENCGKIDNDGTAVQKSIPAGKAKDLSVVKKGDESGSGRQPILMSHGQAADLCLIANQMPTNPVVSTQIKFVPIRLELDARAKNHLSKECVYWKFVPCTNDETDVLATNDCGKWHVVIAKLKECEMYHIFVERNLQIPEHGNYSQVVEDFFQSAPGDNLVNGLSMDEISFDDMEIRSVSDLVLCQRFDSSISCTILPRSPLRIKREKHPLRIKRYNRNCCSSSGCYRCHGYDAEQYSWLRESTRNRCMHGNLTEGELHRFRRFRCDCRCSSPYICTGALFPEANVCADCAEGMGRSL